MPPHLQHQLRRPRQPAHPMLLSLAILATLATAAGCGGGAGTQAALADTAPAQVSAVPAADTPAPAVFTAFTAGVTSDSSPTLSVATAETAPLAAADTIVTVADLAAEAELPPALDSALTATPPVATPATVEPAATPALSEPAAAGASAQSAATAIVTAPAAPAAPNPADAVPAAPAVPTPTPTPTPAPAAPSTTQTVATPEPTLVVPTPTPTAPAAMPSSPSTPQAVVVAVPPAPTVVASLGGNTAATSMPNCDPAQHDDFVDNGIWALRRVLPRTCAQVRDNPPSFVWTQPKDRDPASPWTLTLQTQAGQPVWARQVPTRRHTPDAALAAGTYRWQVSYRALDGTVRSSAWRPFQVLAGLPAATLPTAADVASLAAAKAAPRVLPKGVTWTAAAATASAMDSGILFSQLQKAADRALATGLTASPESRTRDSFASDSEHAAWLRSLMSLTSEELRHVEALSYLWRFSRDARHLTAAKQRLLNLAAWNASGASSEASQPQANRNLYLALAVGIDLIGDQLTSAERQRVAAAFEARVGAAMTTLERLEVTPYLSFENTSIHYTTQALLLVVGRPEFPQASGWLQRVWPVYVADFQTWAEDDGGYGGSVAYAWYDLHHQSRTLATVALVTGIDMSRRSYVRRAGDFLIATTGVNQPGLNAFGDGLEETLLYQNYVPDAFRLYAALTRNATHTWYWQQRPLKVETARYMNPLHMMMAARGLPAPAATAPTQSDWFFENVGVAALHDNVASTQRTSVMFRASRFGSYNHGHADQNSFTFTSKGRNLLISSGYYPYYLSPHHGGVTRATRYKNAVTFDGGIGQAESSVPPLAPTRPMSSMEPRGALLNTHSGSNVSVVTGDATAAYRAWNAKTATWVPLLHTALRSVAYLKSADVVVVYDHLGSDTPRRWELNYHGLEPFTQSGATLVAHNGSASACIEHFGLAGASTLTSGFEFAPENGKPDQHHARYAALVPSDHASVVTVLRNDCKAHVVNVRFDGAKATVKVGTIVLTFDRQNATVAQ